MPSTGVASAVLDGAQVVLPLAGLVDVGEERAKLEKQIAETEAEVGRQEGKLSNEQFTSKAPEAVVQNEREKLAAAQARLEALRGRLSEL